MALEAITEQFSFDITISRSRYAELLIAEHDANCLIDIINKKAKAHEAIDNKEVLLLNDLYFYPTEEKESEE